MEDTRKILCDRCKKTVPLSDVRYVAKGKDQMRTLCSACRAQTSVQDPKQTVTKQPMYPKSQMQPKVPSAADLSRKVEAAKPRQVSDESGQKVNYICERCMYKFKYNTKSKTELKCPYCGRSDKVKENDF